MRVGAGVVLDQLNHFLRPAWLCFGPDVATSSRATIGGMIANNSSGAHAPVYGTTADHLSRTRNRPGRGTLREDRSAARSPAAAARIGGGCRPAERTAHCRALSARACGNAGPATRWTAVCKSRATSTTSFAAAKARWPPSFRPTENRARCPKRRAWGCCSFDSVAEAMQATVSCSISSRRRSNTLTGCCWIRPAGSANFQAARDLLNLDARPCESILIVSSLTNCRRRLAALERRQSGLAPEDSPDRSGRRPGLGAAQSRPVAADRPQGRRQTGAGHRGRGRAAASDLPEYVAELQSLMKRLGLQASYYGHAAAGLLHVRPVLDLHPAGDLKKFRQIADEVSALVQQFKGSLAAEHGVGIARTEFLPEQLGEDLLSVMRADQRILRSAQSFQSGQRSCPTAGIKLTRICAGSGQDLKLPFEPLLAFAAKDDSFIRNLEQCNGCGGCRKETPTMCPTFIATGPGNHVHARARQCHPRGAGVARRFQGRSAAFARNWRWRLSNCLSCKACTNECPSNVNLALLKAELLHARIQRHGLTLQRTAVQFRGPAGPARLHHADRWPTSLLDRFPLALRHRRGFWASPRNGRCRDSPGSASTRGSPNAQLGAIPARAG